MASICKKHSIGSTKGPRQTKLEWTNDGPFGTPSPTLRCRDSYYVAYVEFCGPDDVLNGLWEDVQECARVAAVTATIAAIFSNPGSVTPAFTLAFKACLSTKIGARVDEFQIHLSVSDETGDWGAC